MVYQGVVSPSTATERLNYIHFDVKAGLRSAQTQINVLIDELVDPNKALVIDGKTYKGADKFSAAATLALNNKMSQLSDTTTTMISVFSELFKMEKTLGGVTS